jgi:hypothetical protein
MFNISDILQKRQESHGKYREHAAAKDMIYEVLSALPNWRSATPVQRQAALAIIDKLIRAFNGKPSFTDHWQDVMGYAQLCLTDAPAHIDNDDVDPCCRLCNYYANSSLRPVNHACCASCTHYIYIGEQCDLKCKSESWTITTEDIV